MSNNEQKNKEIDANENKKNKKNAVKSLLIVILMLAVICSGVYIGYYLYERYNAKSDINKLSDLASTTIVDSSDDSIDSPIDFDSLTSQNDEIYAWIVVPNTKVDYPIVQSKSDDLFYLDHSAYDKSYIASGGIFTQSCNSKDFSDPVTLIYGHNGYSDIMFVTLHKFEKEKFFKENEYFYIYTENSKLTYHIFSAFKYDNRHIMNTFDFTDKKVLKEFQDTISNPSSVMKNIRDGIDLKTTDKIVILSTCLNNDNSGKYLVCGVLTKNEETK